MTTIITYKLIADTLQQIDQKITLLRSLYQVDYSLDSTFTTISKFKSDSREAREQITIAINQLLGERKKLINSLKSIANVFNDIEEKIFLSRVFEKKPYIQIANELGVTEGYCKNVGANVIKRINLMMCEDKDEEAESIAKTCQEEMSDGE